MSPQILFENGPGEEAGRVVRGISVPIDAGRRDDRPEAKSSSSWCRRERSSSACGPAAPGCRLYTPTESAPRSARAKSRASFGRPHGALRAGRFARTSRSCARPRPIRRGISCFTAAAATSTRSGRRPESFVIAEVDEIVASATLDRSASSRRESSATACSARTVKLDRAPVDRDDAEDRSRRAGSRRGCRHPADLMAARTAALFREGEIVNLGSVLPTQMLEPRRRAGRRAHAETASSATVRSGGRGKRTSISTRRRTARDRASGRGVFPLRRTRSRCARRPRRQDRARRVPGGAERGPRELEGAASAAPVRSAARWTRGRAAAR